MDALLNRIVQLCKGDKKKAKDLVAAAQLKHPGNSELWYLQKVISELEQQQAEYFRSRRSTQVLMPAQTRSPTAQKQRLIAILGAEQAERTINYIELFNPGKSEDWCIETALTDMEKERRHAVEKSKVLTSPVSREVQNKLFAMVNGDNSMANRLLDHTRKLNSHRTEQWVWEKVIYDLERDRM
ncbi:MAG: hypothetical protein KME45_32795 [Stenomitos rutilans HA7619-LM2]|jgi:hypothetical protein|nr:hypothetical protein [Stenomitos rutilans HA7619-LM2]